MSVQNRFEILNVKTIVDMALSRKLHPNPIGQRPAVTGGHSKSHGIVRACILGYGIGMITVRDIRNDHAAQEIYPGYDYLVIDGGHRIRGLVNYFLGKFKINGKTYSESDYDFDTMTVPVNCITCSSKESIEIFRNLNETTSVNPIEMIMSDDISVICKEVRSRTQFYREYMNKPHSLFERTINRKDEEVAVKFNTFPNPRREWDKYVFVAIHKTIGGGNVDAGEKDTENLIELEYQGENKVTKTVLKTVDSFLDDVDEFQTYHELKLNGDIFSALQLVWFDLYARNPTFKITDMELFFDNFKNVYSLLTGKDTTYNERTIVIDDLRVNLKEYVRKNMKNFSNGHSQRQVAKIFREEMLNDPKLFGVTFRDVKRSLTTAERDEKLALQGYRCAIDGKRLNLQDSVWGHDTAWSKGGKLEDGAVIRKTHNRDMGTMTIEQYRQTL